LVKNLQVYSRDSSINKIAVHKLISSLKKEFSLSISFLSISFIKSSELREINRNYLNHDYETDIITFNYSKKKKDIDGEILISFEEAKRNAKKFRVSYAKELSRLVIHGILHLLKFDDNNRKNKNIMKEMENKLTLNYNFTLFAGK
jgi:probable rRNA maturation factor